MSDELLTLGRDLLSMGQKIIDANQGGDNESKEKKKPEGGNLDMPNKSLIIASLKRKIGE